MVKHFLHLHFSCFKKQLLEASCFCLYMQWHLCVINRILKKKILNCWAFSQFFPFSADTYLKLNLVRTFSDCADRHICAIRYCCVFTISCVHLIKKNHAHLWHGFRVNMCLLMWVWHWRYLANVSHRCEHDMELYLLVCVGGERDWEGGNTLE